MLRILKRNVVRAGTIVALAVAAVAAADSDIILKISVSPDDKVTLNGRAVPLAELDSALSESAKKGREIWFHRLMNNKGSPASAKILKFAADHHVPIRFAGKADFSDVGKPSEISSAKRVVVSAPRPEYPQSARERGIGGGGVFVQHVDRATGEVTQVTVDRSTGSELLDRCVVDALRQWKYKTPAKTEKVKIPITFVPAKGNVSY